MKSQELKENGFTDGGIKNLIRVIESVMPHLPGNWEFINTDSKLEFISNNKVTIEGYINSNKPNLPIQEMPFDFLNSDDAKRLNELQSASTAIRTYL